MIKIFLIRTKKEHAVDGLPTIYHSVYGVVEDKAPWIIIDLAKEILISKVVITIRKYIDSFKAFAGVKVNIIIDLATIR